jgi:cellulose synthase/poly-beta-1,6-N-acetylglucosamine synthase-like glycosyltransferase/peptidoglycan/xylan/chitin deacetylase (PgdA/CDA1 family)/spore germination protein YaaH
VARPVFFDPTGRRRRNARLWALGALALIVLLSLAFASTVLTVSTPSPLPLGFERRTALPLKSQVSSLSARLGHLFNRQAGVVKAAETGTQPITVAFYTSWTESSAPSLAKHLGQVDWVAPTLLFLGQNGGMKTADDAPLRRVLTGALHQPLVVPVLQNAENSQWNGDLAAAIVHDPARRTALEKQIVDYIAISGYGGIMVDFERMPASSMRDLQAFLSELKATLGPRHKVVSATVPVDDPTWNLPAFANVTDKIILMAYDEHSEPGDPGPVASDGWFWNHVSQSLAGLPKGKAIVALGNYGYDWHDGKADTQTVEEGWLDAHDSGVTKIYNKASGNLGFAYDDQGSRHEVWLLDAASSWNQMQMLSKLGIKDVALWRLGAEDPGFWPTLKAWRDGGNVKPDLTRIDEATNVDVEGKGEILRVTETPTPGTRTVDFDPRNGLITGEDYTKLPTPYVVQKTGMRDKLVALTFDDGPDPKWTPAILSVLEKYHVPATFFIIGENGVGNRGLLKRMVADGDEIGNHSYTHPNMADEGRTGVSLELNATQRLIEAYTGRSTRLFRAPYFGDAEPTTPDELGPALQAQQRGYTVVGLHVDPDDWKRPGVPSIVQTTIDGVTSVDGSSTTVDHSANIVLLHDGGGDRTQTIEALPQIIEGLQKQGYRFVPVSTLAGLRQDQVMPAVSGFDLIAVQADVGLFSLLAMLLSGLDWLFFFAIALGIMRALGLTALALIPERRIGLPKVAPGEPPSTALVSVIIPAFNEERVIEASVRRILESDYANLEVIVADDGSKDRTSEIVAAAYGNNPRVKLMTLVNGGKAAALNRALTVARGDVVVALDADTQFETTTITKLVRWFAKSRIGAVAGNAKVGNRVNLITKWQAVEYVTAQNIERRALTRFDAIMVVPGAVGAWRRAALETVGGFPEDTMAEDQDLTIAIQRAGWSVAYDEDAVAWTEAPETLRALSKQRFRWAFGTLQCLWKHRAILRGGKPGGLAYVGMPQAWLFQILFALISPLIDLALAISIVGTTVRVAQHGFAQTQTDLLRMALFWGAFSTIDLVCGFVAARLDPREKRFHPFLLLSQRFVYRQLMYGVVIRAVGAALSGLGVGWGKLERSGRVSNPALVG